MNYLLPKQSRKQLMITDLLLLHFDPALTYDELNIRLKGRSALNFKIDWQQDSKSVSCFQ